MNNASSRQSPSPLQSSDDQPLSSTGSRAAGITLIILGILAILLPTVFTLGFQILIGLLLIVAGVAQLADAFTSARGGHRALHAIAGVLSLLVGVLFLANPFEGAAVLTSILAALFLVFGIARLYFAWRSRGSPGAGWSALNGVLGILIAVLIWSRWPSASSWFIGLLLGIDFLFLGIVLLVAQRVPRESLSLRPESRGIGGESNTPAR